MGFAQPNARVAPSRWRQKIFNAMVHPFGEWFIRQRDVITLIQLALNPFSNQAGTIDIHMVFVSEQ